MQSFQKDDRVIYGSNGVCRILGIERKKLGPKFADYYVLSPLNDGTARFYVPTQNETAVSKLSPILTKQEIFELLNADPENADVWTDEEMERRQKYKLLLLHNDRKALICMVRCLRSHKQSQETAGKKFHMTDENFLRDAQRLLAAEFAASLCISVREAEELIQGHM